VVSFTPLPLYPAGIGGWVILRTGMDDMEQKKTYFYRDLNNDLSAMPPITSRYTD
jgi:hypothetical protein